MSYKPTLGGLKKLQAFLASSPFPMPIVQIDVYPAGRNAAWHDVPGKGVAVNLDELIAEHGAYAEITDVRLSSEDGRVFILFTDVKHIGGLTMIDLMDSNMACRFEWPNTPPVFVAYIEEHAQALLRLARWGKPKTSLLDVLSFRIAPRRYAARALA